MTFISREGQKWVVLVDCNNFFVSCERLFDPKLRKKPVVVLSGNEGCIIARSEEAKALGIPMGAPFFQWKELMEKRGVIIRSSNFSLYGDISNRVMHTLFDFHSEGEIYSVDEAFLFFDDKDEAVNALGAIRERVLRWVGIPVSVGLGATKTLAKVASEKAKKEKKGIFAIVEETVREKILSTLAVIDVWGIGRATSAFLAKKGIRTALAFSKKSEEWLKKNLSVQGLRVALELRGISCFTDEEPRAKQSIMTSRSFISPIFEKQELSSCVAHFAERGGWKLREEGSVASTLDIFIMTSPHKENHYSNAAHITFPEPTDYIPRLIESATRGLEAIFKANLPYKKAGVLLSGIVPKNSYQKDLFAPLRDEEKEEKAMAVLQESREKFGYDILHFAASASKKTPWRGSPTLISPCYTTQWDDLLSV